MKTWQLQEAKARFSEVIKKAAKEGPQAITVHGESTAVVLSRAEYERLKQQKVSLVEFMRKSPLHGVGLKLVRKQSLTRKTDVA
jgi:prevent-host-death family protein